jgi:hypothetical protein
LTYAKNWKARRMIIDRQEVVTPRILFVRDAPPLYKG